MHNISCMKGCLLEVIGQLVLSSPAFCKHKTKRCLPKFIFIKILIKRLPMILSNANLFLFGKYNSEFWQISKITGVQLASLANSRYSRIGGSYHVRFYITIRVHPHIINQRYRYKSVSLVQSDKVRLPEMTARSTCLRARIQILFASVLEWFAAESIIRTRSHLPLPSFSLPLPSPFYPLAPRSAEYYIPPTVRIPIIESSHDVSSAEEFRYFSATPPSTSGTEIPLACRRPLRKEIVHVYLPYKCHNKKEYERIAEMPSRHFSFFISTTTNKILTRNVDFVECIRAAGETGHGPRHVLSDSRHFSNSTLLNFRTWEGRIITWFVSTWVTIKREGPISPRIFVRAAEERSRLVN
ncbi:hypothetical protein PUN28_000779 [Cardiocondyla obscurior]|uniref:Uncharacterized protein n=1 Tax=Cardiocondyla obscurior TaxID=286306 RepID=A0AAW2H0Z6_9HYME